MLLDGPPRRTAVYAVLAFAIFAIARHRALTTTSATLGTTEIAPGVFLPLINLGTGSNHTAWFEHGGRGADTAYDYGNEEQREIGAAIRHAVKNGVPRSELFVTTKVPCCPSPFWCTNNGVGTGEGDYWQWYEWPPVGPSKADGPTVATTDLIQIADHNLAQLGLEFADLMILHMPCTTHEESLRRYRVLEEVYRQGKARAIGVANFDAEQLEALYAAATIKPAVNQVGFGLGQPYTPWMKDLGDGRGDRVKAAIAKSQELGVHLMSYGGLGGSTLQSFSALVSHPTVAEVALAHGISGAQVAMRWLVQQGMAVVTAGMNPGHYDEDVAVVKDVQLSESEMGRLSAVTERLV